MPLFSLVAWLSLPQAFAQASPEDSPSSAPRTMTLRDCVKMALERNPDVLSSADDVAIADAHRKESRGEFGPAVRAEGSEQRWTEDYTINFASMRFVLHDKTTWNLTLSASQPITQLFQLFEQYKSREVGVDIARVRQEVVRRESGLPRRRGLLPSPPGREARRSRRRLGGPAHPAAPPGHVVSR